MGVLIDIPVHLIAFLWLALVFLPSCEKSEDPVETEMRAGPYISKIWLNNRNNLQEEFFYDGYFRLVRRQKHHSDIPLLTELDYESYYYNEQDRMSRVKISTSYYQYELIYEYGGYGNLEKTIWEDGSQNRIFYSYQHDGKGNIIQEDLYRNDTLLQQTEFTWDEKGNIVQVDIYGLNRDKMSFIHLETLICHYDSMKNPFHLLDIPQPHVFYSSKNNITLNMRIDRVAGDTSSVMRTYTYDSDGYPGKFSALGSDVLYEYLE